MRWNVSGLKRIEWYWINLNDIKVFSENWWNDIKWYGKELNGMESNQMERSDIVLERLSVMERNENELYCDRMRCNEIKLNGRGWNRVQWSGMK